VRDETLETSSARGPGTEDAHDGEASAGYEDAARLTQDQGRVPELIQCTAADGPREGAVGELEVVGVYPREGRLRADPVGATGSLLEHRRRDVYADDGAVIVEGAGQAAGVEAGGAAEVEIAPAAL
jgi:hypothetical protein